MHIRPQLLTFRAALRREIAEHRLNRFLHVHVALCAVVGLLPLFTPDAAERSAPAWALQSVLYCLSLSALRVTMIFGLEQVAPASIGASPIVQWWLGHGFTWLAVLLTAWMGATFALGCLGARRRLDL